MPSRHARRPARPLAAAALAFATLAAPSLAVATLAGCSTAPADAGAGGDAHGAPRGAVVRHFASPGTALGALPFSEAVQVGDLLFVSGQIGNRPGTLELVEGGIAAETRQTLENVRAVLERHGSSMDRVVKCTVFLADVGEWPAMNEVYRTFFPGAPPARSAAGANGLALGARVEIEAVAVVGPASP